MADPARGRLILGSASPRRASLLASLGVPFDVRTVQVNEHSLVEAVDVAAVASVVRIAAAKFDAFGSLASSKDGSRILLTADTLVACNNTVMGKPETVQHAAAMLRQMSDRTLAISTALCVGTPGAVPVPRVVTTMVRLRGLSAAEIDDYVASGVGADKAAGLALQAEARPFIASVDGCWSNVLGLPICAVAAALELSPPDLGQDQRCSHDLCGDWRLTA